MSSQPFKVVLVGDVATGKTALIQRLVTNGFTEGHAQTIVASCQSKTLLIRDNKQVSINIWDTAGQERFRALISNFYRGSHGIIICYDVSDPGSLDVIPTWVEAAQNNVEDDVCWMLVGCKNDLVSCVNEDKLQEINERYGFTHMTCSSKTGDNVTEVFKRLCELIVSKLPEMSNGESDKGDKEEDEIISIVAQPRDVENNGNGSCC